MYEAEKIVAADKPELYRLLDAQAGALVSGESDAQANAANIAALLFHQLPDLNWAGFYFMKGGELVVGPFQGLPACVRIQPGRVVGGTAAAQRKTIVVEDVAQFPGHIPCDGASRSEIVVPLVSDDDVLVGVLDLDSPVPGRFDQADARGLEAIARRYVSSLAG